MNPKESRACPGQQEQHRRFTFTDLKHQAAEYYRINEVPQRLEEVLNSMFYLRPADFYGHLANYFSELSNPPVICTLVGKRILDGMGRLTLEVEVSCHVRNCDKKICSSVISSHAEILENALPEAVDADEKERYQSVNRAVEWINKSLNEIFVGLSPLEQYKIDELLCQFYRKKEEEEIIVREPEKEKEIQETEVPVASPPVPAGKKKAGKAAKKASIIEKPIPPPEPAEPIIKGSMAISGLSLAIAKTAAIIRNVPLYAHIAWLKHNQEMPKELVMPLLMTTILSCGKSSPGKLNLMKELILIPPAWLTIKQGVERCLEIQKEIMKLIDPVVKMPSTVPEVKKPGTRDAGKKAPPPVLKKISHLGCLVTGYESLEQPLTLIQTACSHLSLELGIDIFLGINCAAHELMDYNKGKYEVLFGTPKNPDEMIDMYVDLIHKFPSIIALIDPLRKEDRQQWTALCNILGSKCYIIAENSSRSVSKFLENRNIKCSGLIIKYLNEASISDLLEATQILDGQKKRVYIIGSPDGESSDDSLVDLAVGLGARFIKLGGLLRGERVIKYNRLLAIEEELGKNGKLCERDEHEFVDFTEEEEDDEEEESARIEGSRTAM